MTDAEAEHMAAYIDRCTQALERMAPENREWHLLLPEPVDDIERQALRLFTDMIAREVGMPPPRGTA
jgi:hypothetical protein